MEERSGPWTWNAGPFTAVPAMGRMAGENTTPLSGPSDSVALLIGDDTIPQTVEVESFGQEAGLHTSPGHLVTAPLWLYVGQKNASNC